MSHNQNYFESFGPIIILIMTINNHSIFNFNTNFIIIHKCSINLKIIYFHNPYHHNYHY